MILRLKDTITDIEDIVNPEPKPKAKPKPRIRVKKQPLEIMPVVKEEPKEEIKEEPKTDKIKKVIELVECPKCNKMMNAKSLRYTHEKTVKVRYHQRLKNYLLREEQLILNQLRKMMN
jgi:hypothetical protein